MGRPLFRFWLALALSVSGIGAFARDASELKKHYRLIVSGAGPAGLSAALAAIRNGVMPDEILIVEKRPLDGKHAWGTRQRVVVLDGNSVKTLGENQVRLPGVSFKQMVAEFENKAPRYFPNGGAWKSAIGFLFGRRSLDRLSSIAELEKKQLQAFERAGGHVRFGKTLNIVGPSSAEIDKKIVTGDLIVIAEGANSTSAKIVPAIPVATTSTSNFLTIDIPFNENYRIRPGDVHSISYPKKKVMVYSFVGHATASINMMLPPNLTIEVLKQDQRLHDEYLTLLKQSVERFGFGSSVTIAKPSYYSGQLSMRESVKYGNVVFIGESLRTVDAISGTGANSALADSRAVGDFFVDTDSLGEGAARSRLVEKLKYNTREAFEYSLFFRELANYAFGSSRLLESAQQLGLTDRGIGSSALDLGKSLYAGLFILVAGEGVQQRLIRNGMAAADAPRFPFQSPERKMVIGEVHPSDGCSAHLR